MINTNLLKGAIASAGYTQRSLAKQIKMSENALNHKVNGKKDFKLGEVTTICEALAITDDKQKLEIFLSLSSQ